MTTVENIVTRPGGSIVAGGRVRVRLIASIPAGGAGFATDRTIISERWLVTDSVGAWSANLTANSAITPAGTVYEVIENAGHAGATAYYVTVPSSGGPYWTGDILTTNPAPLPLYRAAESNVMTLYRVSANIATTLANTFNHSGLLPLTQLPGGDVRTFYLADLRRQPTDNAAVPDAWDPQGWRLSTTHDSSEWWGGVFPAYTLLELPEGIYSLYLRAQSSSASVPTTFEPSFDYAHDYGAGDTVNSHYPLKSQGAANRFTSGGIYHFTERAYSLVVTSTTTPVVVVPALEWKCAAVGTAFVYNLAVWKIA